VYIGIIIFFVALIILYIILAVFFRKLFKIMGIISFVLFVILAVFGFFLYLDFRDIKENFPNSNNTILIDVDGEIVGGFTFFNGHEPEFAEGLEVINDHYLRKDFEAMKGDSYLLMIVNKYALASAKDVEIAGYTFTYDECIEMLKSGEPMLLFADKVLYGNRFLIEEMIIEQLDKSFESDEKLKSVVAASLFSNSLSNSQGMRIIEGIQKGYITVYPNKLVFRMIKFIPKSMVQDIISGMEIKNGE
jgi:hypothetical protein